MQAAVKALATGGLALALGGLPAGPATGATATQRCSAYSDGTTSTSCPIITFVHVSRAAVTISDTKLVPLIYTVGLQRRDGAAYTTPGGQILDSPYSAPALQLGNTRAGATWPGHYTGAVSLHLVSSTSTEGRWQGTIYVPSTAAGTVVAKTVSFVTSDDPG